MNKGHTISFLIPLLGLDLFLAAHAQADRWREGAEMNTSRVFHGSCAANGRVYVFGGQRLGGEAGITSVEEYDPIRGVWTARADMPTARLGMMVGSVDDRCYLIGGAQLPGGAGLSLVEEYDPASDSWRTRADMPTPRVAGASAVVDGIIYVAGGWETGSTISPAVSAMEAYDPAANAWISRTDMPSARALTAAAAVGGQVYVVGGGSAAMGSLDSAMVDQYDPVNDRWARAADLPTPRGALAAAGVDGRIYAIGGGFEIGEVDAVEVFDPASGTWSARTPMPTARWGVSGNVLNDRIYVLGGSTELGVGHNSLALTEEYTPEVFQINAGLNDAWFFPETPGQGFFIVVYPELEIVFLAWFTYDTERPPANVSALLGEPGHRWLTAQGPYSGETAELTVFLSEGGVFDAPEPAVPAPTVVGSLTLTWIDCSQAIVSYDLSSVGRADDIPIQRVAPDNVALCEALREP